MVHLVIFDIGGTLLNAKDPIDALWNVQFAQRFGFSDTFRDISFAGATDLSLVRQVPSRSGKSLTHRFLDYLIEELNKDPGAVIPRLPDLLFVLQSEGVFPVGGFEESGVNGGQAVDEVIKQCLVHYRIHPGRISLIGGTPHDVVAAWVNGIRCIAVATSPFSFQEVEQHHPDEVVADVFSVDGVLSVLQS